MGVHFDTSHDMISNYTWATGLWMLFAANIVFVIFGLWLDQIWLREYGERKPFYFCCTPKWWGCGKY
jgi:hypothetical protein